MAGNTQPPVTQAARGSTNVPPPVNQAPPETRPVAPPTRGGDYAFLDDVANNPGQYRTPYQTIVLLNTYHYMYWGSGYSDKHWADHEYLLGTLAGICTDRVIFMSPLEIEHCPSDIARRAKQHPEWAPNFTTEKFLEVAGKYFDVTHEGYLGIRPLYLMKRK